MAPGLSFCPTMSSLEKCLLQMTERFFGIQDMSLLFTTRRHSIVYLTTCSFGNEKNLTSFFLFLVVESQELTAQYLKPPVILS